MGSGRDGIGLGKGLADGLADGLAEGLGAEPGGRTGTGGELGDWDGDGGKGVIDVVGGAIAEADGDIGSVGALTNLYFTLTAR